MRKLGGRILMFALCAGLMAGAQGLGVHAEETTVSGNQPQTGNQTQGDPSQTGGQTQGGQPQTGGQTQAATAEERNTAKSELQNYLNRHKSSSAFSDMKKVVADSYQKIDAGTMTKAQLDEYVLQQKQYLDVLSVEPARQDTTVSNNSVKSGPKISDSDRGRADEELKNHMDKLKNRYQLDTYYAQLLEKSFYSAVYYIANTEMSEVELWEFVSKAKADMDAIAGKTNETVTSATGEFLQLGDNWQTPKVSYGRQVAIVVPIINLGTEGLTELIVQPEVSNDVTKWPFEPDSTGYVQTIPEIPGNPNYETAMKNRREVTYYLTAREDVLTGYYPLTFDIYYTKAGIRSEEPVKLTLYVETEGAPGSGTIGMNPAENSAKPRIVVTGFTTDPQEIYAGSTFNVTIHVRNTSPSTAISNALFDLQAVESGSEANTTYAVFLPTSGASSIYVPKLAPGAEMDLKIEMSAKADLTQKPYVITVNMKYDAGSAKDLTDSANVSIPVLQKSKFDTSTPEVMPNSITVGDQSNVMFSVYNTGKTTLYNVKVEYVGDSITGGDVFLGNIKPGETGNADSMVTGSAVTMDEGKIKAVVSYEDESGNPFTKEIELELFVTEPMDDMGMMDPGMMGEGEEQGPKTGRIVLIVVIAVLAAAAAGTVIFLKLRRKKKAASELAKDLVDLDEEQKTSNDEN